MKKMIVLIALVFQVVLASAQTSNIETATSGDSVGNSRLLNLEERLSQQERETLALKKENLLLRKELEAVKSQRRELLKPKKFTVSRNGSKQVVVE